MPTSLDFGLGIGKEVKQLDDLRVFGFVFLKGK